MHHYQLIETCDLTKLTAQELRDLDARLRQIREHDADLTDRDIIVILASLRNICVAFQMRNIDCAR